MIACPACGAPNEASFSKCQQCGRALAERPARPRLPVAAAGALVVAGLATFAALGNWVSSRNAGGPVEIANIAVTVPAGWAVQATEPNTILLTAGSGAGVLLISTAVPNPTEARALAISTGDNLRQGSPGAERCSEPEAQPMPSLSWPGYRVVECGVGGQSIAVVAATSPDGHTAYVIAISGLPETLRQVESIFDERIAPTISWKLASAASAP